MVGVDGHRGSASVRPAHLPDSRPGSVPLPVALSASRGVWAGVAAGAVHELTGVRLVPHPSRLKMATGTRPAQCPAEQAEPEYRADQVSERQKDKPLCADADDHDTVGIARTKQSMHEGKDECLQRHRQAHNAHGPASQLTGRFLVNEYGVLLNDQFHQALQSLFLYQIAPVAVMLDQGHSLC